MIQMNMSTRKPRSIRRVGAQDSKDWQVPALSAVEPAVEPALAMRGNLGEAVAVGEGLGSPEGLFVTWV